MKNYHLSEGRERLIKRLIYRVKHFFHRLFWKTVYVEITEEELKTAFQSEANLTDFISDVINRAEYKQAQEELKNNPIGFYGKEVILIDKDNPNHRV